MADADLVRMANQIGANLPHLAEEQAATVVATHIRSFWAPPMRADLLRVAVTSPEQLSRVALLACRILDPDAGIPEPAAGRATAIG